MKLTRPQRTALARLGKKCVAYPGEYFRASDIEVTDRNVLRQLDRLGLVSLLRGNPYEQEAYRITTAGWEVLGK